MEILYSHPDIPAIMSIFGNSTCCSCDKENPTFISLNNGIFLCQACAEIHKKKLDPEISQILSLKKDCFNDDQLLYLSLGGNHNYKLCLAEYNITPDSSLELRFKSKAADYYRKILKDKVMQKIDKQYKEIIINKPSEERGKQIIEYFKEKKESGSNTNNNYNPITKRRGSNRNRILQNAFEKSNENLKHVAQNAGESLKVLALGAGEGIMNIFKQAKNYIMSKNEEKEKKEEGANDLNNINNNNSDEDANNINNINNAENGATVNNDLVKETDEQAQERRDKEEKGKNEL